MGGRFVGMNPFSRFLMALVAVAGATAVVLALTRNTTPDSTSSTSVDADESDRTDALPATDSAASAASSTASSMSVTSSTRSATDPKPESAETSLFEDDDTYRWLWVEPDDLRFVWRDDEGVPYNQLEAARLALEERGEPVMAITNGGIHRPGLIPSGLYVEDGVELTPLNRATGSGNFFLQPNGVFWIDDGQAGIETTEDYGGVDREVEAAVQSGPMLVIDSSINPAFNESSTSTHRRNAVGVDAEGRVLLIMADRAVNLWAMADRCRELGAINALYLDGTLSRLERVIDGRPIFPNLPVASMIAVVDSRIDSGS